ncbi:MULTISPECIES: thiolase family protein [Christiangramia]|uniref:3-ketoacyl-CoA thiolase n=1 Tax=Christiangramia flava JLT2011 TaxID=1229726 RepID=A0A1L7IAM8_9FLAO|nr:thiolase family protein [Christiangramia flava]APU70165.1 3-ketoacyl-CoA thiolase [Christiangramia flava JLT2011]OSS39652.1 3-ketoacyl-CoA thiolase [Christiangramia flava JLT2011]
MKKTNDTIWLIAGLRTPFAKVDKEFKDKDALQLSIPLVQEMVKRDLISPDFFVWGSVAPNLGYSNLAREILMDAGLDQSIPAFTTIMACSTSMMAAIEAAGLITEEEVALVGGVESMSRVQLGLNQNFSDWLRRFFQSRTLADKFSKLKDLSFGDIKLFIPSVTNRTTGLSMGEHSEITTKRLQIDRERQDEIALKSHQNYIKGRNKGFFNDLVLPLNGIEEDKIPRENTSLEQLTKLNPVFDKESGKGSITAGNSSLLTDGAAGLWVCGSKVKDKFSANSYAAQLIDWEIAAVNIEKEGLLMATTFAIPRLLERHKLRYDDIDLWEIHEAFGAQVVANIKLLKDKNHLKKVGVSFDFGAFPWDHLNPNGGSIAIGHPFGATGARIINQAIKELTLMGPGKKAVVSVCADGGLGTVMLLES